MMKQRQTQLAQLRSDGAAINKSLSRLSGEKKQQQHVCLQISGQLCFFSRFLKKCGLLEISFSTSFMKDLKKHEIGTWKYLERQQQQQQQREEESKANCSLLAGTGSLGMLVKRLSCLYINPITSSAGEYFCLRPSAKDQGIT